MTYYFCPLRNATLVYCNYNSPHPPKNSFPALMINYSDYQLPDGPDHELSHFQPLPPAPREAFFLGFENSQELARKEWSACFESHLLHFVFAETVDSSLQAQGQPKQPDLPEKKEQVQAVAIRQAKEQKNQTKNIPKNFGKGIITFIEKNQKKLRTLLRDQGLSFNYFMTSIRAQKKTINTISDLRRLWTHEIFGKSMRIISNLFFRKYALDYIFNSRIHNYASHIKYRQSLWQALRNPDHFNRIKEF